jgi:hypothetical protein
VPGYPATGGVVVIAFNSLAHLRNVETSLLHPKACSFLQFQQSVKKRTEVLINFLLRDLTAFRGLLTIGPAAFEIVFPVDAMIVRTGKYEVIRQ